MTQKHLLRGVLIAVLCMAVATPVRADSLSTDVTLIIVGIVVASIALTLGVAVVVTHYSRKRALTGCVVSAAGGLSVTDEADKRTYMLSGNTAAITVGDRVKLQGKKIKSKSPDKTLTWVTTNLAKDFGVCPQ